MKAVLTYDLSDPEDVEAFKRATNSLDMAVALFDIEQCLRLARKNSHTDIDKVSLEIFEIIKEINLENLIS